MMNRPLFLTASLLSLLSCSVSSFSTVSPPRPLRVASCLSAIKNPFLRSNGETASVKQSGEHHHPAGTAAKVTTVEHVDDFTSFLKEDDRLCVVKFHAAWCKSCQKFGVKFRQLALHHGDLECDSELIESGKVRFAQVEFGANASLCRALEIKRLPSVHIYKGNLGKLSGFSCGPSKFPLLVERMEKYLKMTDEELRFEKEMEEGQALGESIATDLQRSATTTEKMS